MFENLFNHVTANPSLIGAYASLVGLLVSVIGFGITLYNVFRTKSAAVRAEKAANEAITSARLFDAVSDVAEVLLMLEEVKRLNRENNWAVLLDRYSELKKKLGQVLVGNQNLITRQKDEIRSTIAHLSNIEHAIEKSLADQTDPSGNVARYNKILSGRIEKLNEVLMELKMAGSG